LGNILSDRFPSTISFRLCVQIFQSCKPTWDLNIKLLFTLYII
jgi:hypothetical protein